MNERVSDEAARPKPVTDRFTTAVFTFVGVIAVAELFALFWLDLI